MIQIVEFFHSRFSRFLLGPDILSKPIVGVELGPEYSDVSAQVTCL